MTQPHLPPGTYTYSNTHLWMGEFVERKAIPHTLEPFDDPSTQTTGYHDPYDNTTHVITLVELKRHHDNLPALDYTPVPDPSTYYPLITTLWRSPSRHNLITSPDEYTRYIHLRNHYHHRHHILLNPDVHYTPPPVPLPRIYILMDPEI